MPLLKMHEYTSRIAPWPYRTTYNGVPNNNHDRYLLSAITKVFGLSIVRHVFQVKGRVNNRSHTDTSVTIDHVMLRAFTPCDGYS